MCFECIRLCKKRSNIIAYCEREVAARPRVCVLSMTGEKNRVCWGGGIFISDEVRVDFIERVNVKDIVMNTKKCALKLQWSSREGLQKRRIRASRGGVTACETFLGSI